MDTFTSGDEAARWLEERLLRLEEAVRQAPELRRLITDGTHDVLIDVDANPHLFYQDATSRLRRYTSQVSQAALRRLERDGFQRGVLERSCMDLLGRDAHRAGVILRAMAETLRQRTEALSQEGTDLYEEGRDAFSEAIDGISASLKEAEQTWTTRGPGRHRRSVLPWRRRRAENASPMDDPQFRAQATAATEPHRDPLERALRTAGQGSALLSTSKYYGDIANVLGDYIAVGENLSRNGLPVAVAAHQRLAQLRQQAPGRTPHSANAALLDDATLDAVLDRLDVNAQTFLTRNAHSTHELADLTSSALEENVRAWVEEQLGGLGVASLAEVLGGLTGDNARVRRRLLRTLSQGQPLMHFNDDLPRGFDGGMRGQCSVLVEASDASLNDALREACHQMDLPTPHIHQVAPDDTNMMSLRILQFVAGLPFFTQVDRLMPMIDTHREVFSSAKHQLSPGIPPGALRDMPNHDELGDLLPAEIERAFRHEQSLTEAPHPAWPTAPPPATYTNGGSSLHPEDPHDGSRDPI